jgi:hypothetical protein
MEKGKQIKNRKCYKNRKSSQLICAPKYVRSRIRTNGSASLLRFGIKYPNFFSQITFLIQSGCVGATSFFLFIIKKYEKRKQIISQCQYRNSCNLICASIHHSRLPSNVTGLHLWMKRLSNVKCQFLKKYHLSTMYGWKRVVYIL